MNKMSGVNSESFRWWVANEMDSVSAAGLLLRSAEMLVSSVLLTAATCISPSLMVSSASGPGGRGFLERASALVFALPERCTM